MRRAGRIVAVALAVAASALGGAEASASEVIGFAPGLTVSNGEWVAASGTAYLQVGSPDAADVMVTGRLELGLGGTAAGLGVAAVPASWHGMMIQYDGLELRVLRTFELSGWREATYIGPQLTIGLLYVSAKVGWMFDVADAANQHPQVGLAFGF